MNDELVEVRFVDLPVALHQRAAQHLDELQRELTYVASEPGTVPARLRELSELITTRFGAFTGGPAAEIEAAVAAGVEAIELRYRLPGEAGEVASLTNVLLDEVEVYCRSGGLLTLAAPADALAYRRWFFGQFAEQVAGSPPCPWPEWIERSGAAPPR